MLFCPMVSKKTLDKCKTEVYLSDISKNNKGPMMGKRRMFYLTDSQFKRLGWICKKTGLSASEILRRAFDEYWEKFERKGRIKT